MLEILIFPQTTDWQQAGFRYQHPSLYSGITNAIFQPFIPPIVPQPPQQAVIEVASICTVSYGGAGR